MDDNQDLMSNVQPGLRVRDFYQDVLEELVHTHAMKIPLRNRTDIQTLTMSHVRWIDRQLTCYHRVYIDPKELRRIRDNHLLVPRPCKVMVYRNRPPNVFLIGEGMNEDDNYKKPPLVTYEPVRMEDIFRIDARPEHWWMPALDWDAPDLGMNVDEAVVRRPFMTIEYISTTHSHIRERFYLSHSLWCTHPWMSFSWCDLDGVLSRYPTSIDDYDKYPIE